MHCILRQAICGAICLLASVSGALAAGKRIALVLGNADYQHVAKLQNPRNDASDMAAVLRKLGFTVIEGSNLDKAAMDRKIRDFAQALPGADLGLFFYAGHGLQVGGVNYLAPVDAKLSTASAIDFEMVRLDLVQRSMERETKTNVIFLDACRDNPLTRNLQRAMGTRSTDVAKGLAPVESGVGTLISYSTQPGNIAVDGEGRNSPFVGALVGRIATSGEDVSSILIGVRNDVMRATGGRQIPWEHSALTDKLYFSPPKPSGPTFEQQAGLAHWATVKDSGDPGMLQSYLDRYPGGEFAGLAKAMIEKIAADRQRTDAQRRAGEERRAADAARKADEERRAKAAAKAEAARAEEARKAAEVARAEEARKAADARRGEEARKAAERVVASSAPATVAPEPAAAAPAGKTATSKAQPANSQAQAPASAKAPPDVAVKAAPTEADHKLHAEKIMKRYNALHYCRAMGPKNELAWAWGSNPQWVRLDALSHCRRKVADPMSCKIVYCHGG